jgi:sphinganine-1-phosphate aldolase
MTKDRIRLPKEGVPKEEVLQALRIAKRNDIQWQEGKAFGMVYLPEKDVSDLLKEAYTLYFSENALNPTAFPSLRRFETEVVAMTASLLGSDGEVVGNMTSGGTESLLMAVKSARDWARDKRPEVSAPEMILPSSAHPALEKAAHYFGVKSIRTPVRADFRADVDAVGAALTPNTILIVGSAPSYPHGVVDPIKAMAELAEEEGILLHVDACMGGFMLPFVRRLGYPVPDFDFQVPGVTSMSADIHKFGYSAKGASVILYRDRMLRRYQLFAYTDWSGGIYASPTMSGTRPAGPIAAAWAIMSHLGEDGYLAIAETVMETTGRIRQGMERLDDIEVLGDPEMSILALASDSLNIYEVGDEMTLRGWYLERQQYPPSLHLTINYGHAKMVEAFLQDLRDALVTARRPSVRRLGRSLLPALARLLTRLLPKRLVSRFMSRASSIVGVKGSTLPTRSAPMYGMMGTLPDRGDLKELVLDLVEQFTQPQE